MLSDEKLLALKTALEEVLKHKDHAVQMLTLEPYNRERVIAVKKLQKETALLLAQVGIMRNPNHDRHS